ncbi:protein phosphatase [Vibrio sp. 10N.286.49.C2]|uniref:protein phosphatase CheZ n=1 Tax=unclassified Vibrio TaxID=2614977 RepID=UPI000C84AA74|nr:MULTISPECIES: protein phosphatase CheZ [unclassified Vibrio]PMH39673.1 protein phosphatase [Vibrio sp. 10N.286.49.C2]PMH57708.1 protein phosphatase [Vibrio sp. 10N.286.49.B1]PMH82744.1 protein phosphatase [Vibrio sp. 10N.286.48.B7]
MISLEQAKQLVELLEEGKQQEANELIIMVQGGSESKVLQEVGALTRDLHDALSEFSIDTRLNEIANDEIPEARDRLEYVINKTEVSANTTMDAVEHCLPMADNLHECLLQVRPQWNELMHGRVELQTFKDLCHRIDNLLTQVEGNSTELRTQLTNILMAQDFQDLTGQIIRRVITLVSEVETRLVEILKVFSDEQQSITTKPKQAPVGVEGPIINPHERIDAVSSQDEVDDLLSSLGF